MLHPSLRRDVKKELPWKITIEKVSNGYSISWWEELNDNVMREVVDVVECDESRSELEAMQNVLWIILEHFAVYKGINVEVEEIL